MIIGHGNYFEKLQDLRNKLELDKKIFFKGWIKKTDKYLLNSKIFILTSLYEGLPKVLIDAMEKAERRIKREKIELKSN